MISLLKLWATILRFPAIYQSIVVLVGIGLIFCIMNSLQLNFPVASHLRRSNKLALDTLFVDSIESAVQSKEFVMPSMLVVLDSHNGLCNQMGDFHDGINFCLYYNLSFTVRHAAFRNDDLISWYPVPFTDLFDDAFLSTIPNYVNYTSISHLMSENNTVNFKGNISVHQLLQKDLPLVPQLQEFNKTFVVLTQCLLMCIAPRHTTIDIYPLLRPSSFLLSQYEQIRDSIFRPTEKYNFLHYRYESDFTTHFNVSMKDLGSTIRDASYRNHTLKLYVATTHIENLINVNAYRGQVVYKNESALYLLNFEQKAMIDFLFGLHAQEVIGHNKSCFSHLLNNYHESDNFYAR